jgi:hypothetical protein
MNGLRLPVSYPLKFGPEFRLGRQSIQTARLEHTCLGHAIFFLRVSSVIAGFASGGVSSMRLAVTRATSESCVFDETTHQLMGVLAVALFSALFWSGLMAAVGAIIGHPPSAFVLMTVAASIAGFLVVVVSRLVARANLMSRGRCSPLAPADEHCPNDNVASSV